MSAPNPLSCNSRIAAALLDVLGSSGQIGARARVLRLAGPDGGALRTPSAWIGEGSLRAMLQAVAEQPRMLERVGQALVAPEMLAFPLRYGGFATAEKALRRCDQIFARESPAGSFEAREIGLGRAVIAYHPGREEEAWAPYCRIRLGMMRAVPLLFGLLPAKVEETQCASRGASHCEFKASWTSNSRQGLAAGALLGAGVVSGLGLLLVGSVLHWPGLVALSCAGAGLGAALGRVLDLSRQLEAVAGARRGQLALLDQADQTLAERMDALAKIEGAAAALQPGAPNPRDASATAAEAEPRAEWWTRTVDDFRSARRELSQALDGNESDRLAAGRAANERLEQIEHGLAAHARDLEGPVVSADLAEIARQAVRCVQHEQHVAGVADPVRVELELGLGGDRAQLECRSYQLEEALIQLLRNALAATPVGGEVWLEIEGEADCFVLSVRDWGPGIPDATLERLFDPFEAPASGAGGLGLRTVSRIASQHEGELRIESQPGETRVSLVLPRHQGPRRPTTS